jgi:hypothetical protein
MIISEKQQEANRQNASHSTGPNTPEGKAAVRLNALTYGLRARDLIFPNEDPEEYKQLWADLLAEWQPQNRTERLHLEQMATSQWLLARYSRSEWRIHQYRLPLEQELPLLDRVSSLRARLERSFTTAMRELKQLQNERQARQPQPAQTAQPAKPASAPVHKPAEPNVPPPAYVMSEGGADHPVSCAPATPDTR